MPGQIEFLNGGLVTSRDPSLLAPGELSVAEDVALLPGSPALQKAPGRRAFNTTALDADIDGLAYCGFDNGNDLLIAAVDGSYIAAAAGETNEFADLATGAGLSLSTASQENRSVLLSGGSQNIVVLSDGTSRPHGMAPVTAAPGYTYAASGGTWPLGADQLGYFDYWTTEVFKSDLDEVEGTFAGTPATINVASAVALVTIYKPATVNTNATHWRVYRSLKKTALLDAAFPVGFLIADIPVATTVFVDGASTTISPVVGTGAGTAESPGAGFGEWTTPTNILADDGAFAVSPTVTGSGTAYIAVNHFGFAPGSPITDIDIRVKAKINAGTPLLMVNIFTDGAPEGTAAGVVKTVPLTSTSTEYTLNGLWGRVWQGVEFADAANFTVRLEVWSATDGGSGSVSIDYVKAGVSHGGTTAAETTQFPNLQIVAGPTSYLVGANGQPPAATTGDVFQGSLVMNDPATPTNIVWTIPGTLDYAPVPYRMALDTGDHDSVQCIRSLGTVCVVGADGSLHRLNMVPVAEDPEFNTGRIIDMFSSDVGIVGPNAAVRVTVGGQLLLFFVGRSGLHMTNGYSVESATDDIVWRTMVNQDLLRRCVVLNNAERAELLVLYASSSASSIDKMLRLAYDPTQLKNGKMKVSGITNYGATGGGTAGITTNGERVLYTANGRYVYVENRGYSDASGGTILPRASSREIHAVGPGGDWELQGLMVRHQGGGGTFDMSLTSSQANYPAAEGDTLPITMTARMLSNTDLGTNGSGITVNIYGRDDGLPMTLDYLVLDSASLGETTTLKQ